ncbi:MAG: hypothetical protein QUS07_07380 [Methanothrix sp.]|nr:hypothetical protein [Methanothrix sp.]
MTVGDITGIASLVLVLVAIWKGWFEGKNLQKTGENLSAELMSKYQEMVDSSLDRSLKLSSRLAELETSDRQKTAEIQDLKEKDRQKDLKIQDLEQQLIDWKDWAERLVAQVESLGVVPEEFISRSTHIGGSNERREVSQRKARRAAKK